MRGIIVASVKLTEDLYAPHPSGREGTFHLIGRKGATVDEKLVAAAKSGKTLHDAVEAPGVVRARPAVEAAEDASEAQQGEGYEAMKVAELRTLADERGIEHDGLKKAELVELLEDADQA